MARFKSHLNVVGGFEVRGKTSNILQVKEFCIEEGPKFSAGQSQRIGYNYAKCLQEEISAKGSKTNF